MNNMQRPYYTATNLSPLYFGCFNATEDLAPKVLAYLNANNIDAFPGGIPNTLVKSGEQWDFPNAWAPTQYIMTEGLRALNDKRATELANKWTNRWVRSNYIAYNDTGYMFEKVRIWPHRSIYLSTICSFLAIPTTTTYFSTFKFGGVAIILNIGLIHLDDFYVVFFFRSLDLSHICSIRLKSLADMAAAGNTMLWSVLVGRMVWSSST